VTSVSILSIFGAGILTFLTPCVLPLIPIYLAVLAGGDMSNIGGAGRGRIVLRAAFFSVGFIMVFILLGLGASSIGAFLSNHRTALQALGAVLILLFGLKFLGVIRVPFLDRVVKADDGRMQTRFGNLNALIMGVVFAAGWSPCVGPILGTVLTYTASTTANPITGGLYLAAYGAGFALPLLLSAVFAEAAVKLIGRLSHHLPRIEKAVGILLLLVAGTMLIEVTQSVMNAPTTAAAGKVAAIETDGTPTMYKFYSENCPICKKMEPVMEKITTQCDKKGVRMIKVNISAPENRHLVGRYRLVGVPTFLFIDERGHETARLLGEQTEQTLKQSLSALRGMPCPGVELLGQGATLPEPGSESSNCAI